MKFCQITSRDGTMPDSKAHGDNMGPIRDRQAEPCYLGLLKCKYSATGCQTLPIDTCDEILMAHISIKIVTYTNRIARIKQHLLWAHTRPRRFRHNLQRDMSALEPPFVLDTQNHPTCHDLPTSQCRKPSPSCVNTCIMVGCIQYTTTAATAGVPPTEAFAHNAFQWQQPRARAIFTWVCR